MFKLNKKSGKASVFCKICNKEVSFSIPHHILDTDQFPVTYRYIHGDPVHSVTFYIDRDMNIRGIEVGDYISISEDTIKGIIERAQMTGSNVSPIFLNNLVNAFTTTITLEYPEADKIIRHSGEYLGKAYADMFKADTLEGTLEKLQKFWAQNGMGTIKDVKIDKDLTTFKVYDCFECRNMPNIGKCVCKFDEGFIEKSLSQSLERDFDVKEVKCIANGDDYCEFEIKPR